MIIKNEEGNNMILEEKMERSLKRNELIITVDEYEVNPGYQERMLLENKIEGLCPLRVVCEDEMKRYCYEISNHETLKDIAKKEKISYDFIKRFLIQIARCFEMLDKYMIEESKVLFEPEYIFLQMNTAKVNMVFFPYKEENIMDFISLTEYLITIVDQEDERAAWVAYSLERDAKMENFSFLAFLNAIREYEAENTYKENVIMEEGLESKKEEKSCERVARQVPTLHYVRLIAIFGMGILYFVAAYFISNVYEREYNKSMLLILIVIVITFLIVLWNIIGIAREKASYS